MLLDVWEDTAFGNTGDAMYSYDQLMQIVARCKDFDVSIIKFCMFVAMFTGTTCKKHCTCLANNDIEVFVLSKGLRVALPMFRWTFLSFLDVFLQYCVDPVKLFQSVKAVYCASIAFSQQRKFKFA